MPETIKEDGTPVLIEAVYYRYNQIYTQKVESVEEGVRFLENGEDWGELSSVGVFVEGVAHTPYGVYAFPENEHKFLGLMAEEYAKLKD